MSLVPVAEGRLLNISWIIGLQQERNERIYIHPILSCFSYRYEKGGSQELRLHNQRCCSLARFPIRKELPAGVDRWSLAHGVFYVEDGWYLCAQPSRICLICYCWFAGIGVGICVVGEMEDDLGGWREGLMDWGWNWGYSGMPFLGMPLFIVHCSWSVAHRVHWNSSNVRKGFPARWLIWRSSPWSHQLQCRRIEFRFYEMASRDIPSVGTRLYKNLAGLLRSIRDRFLRRRRPYVEFWAHQGVFPMASLLVRELNLASFVFAFELRPPIHFFVLVEYPNVVPPLIPLPMAGAFCQIRQAKMFFDEVQSLHAHAASFRGWMDQICVFARLPPFDLWTSHHLRDLWLVFWRQLMCRSWYGALTVLSGRLTAGRFLRSSLFSRSALAWVFRTSPTEPESSSTIFQDLVPCFSSESLCPGQRFVLR